MESHRTGHTIKKLSVNNKGMALFSAILISVIALVTLAALYFALTKLLSSSQTIKTYASVKDAAAGGVHHMITIISDLKSQSIWVGPDNTNPHSNPIPGECIQNPITINFRLTGSSSLHENKISICFLSYSTPPGFETVGVAYSKEIPGEIGDFYTIISEAEGPEPSGEKTKSRIEAVYAR